MKKKLLSFFALAVIGVLAYAATQATQTSRRAEGTEVTFDYVAAGVAGETLTKVNLNFQVNMGEGKEDRTDRNFRGYKDYAGTNLPAECQVAIGEEQKVDENGLIVAQNRYLAVYGLHTGDKVSVYYTGVPEGKTPTYCPGTSVDTKAKIGSTELVPTESAIASGDVIEITKAGSKNYIVMSVFAGMRITKVVIKKAALYDITIADGIENGTVKTSVAKAAAGDEVTVTATPAEFYQLEAITVKDADDADVTVTDGKFTMPAKAVTVSATFTIDSSVETYDYVAAGVAGETLTKVNLNFQVNMGEGKEDRTDRNFRGYKDYAGTNLPAECQVAIGEEQKVDENGLIVAQNRYLAVYGLHTGDKVSVYYTGVPEGKTPTYCPGTSVDTKAKIGSTELVPTESAIASGDVIEITKAGSKNYIVMSVFAGMRITKVVIKKAALYDITIADGIENGTVKTSVAKAAAGDEVTVTATPAEGYGLKAITVTGVNTNLSVEVTDGKFIMPADDVTVNATFVAIPKFYIFGDVTETGWNAVTTEMTFNVEAQAYEYEFEATKDVWFAFSDTEFAVTDGNWETVNAARYSLGGTEPTIGTAQDLVKGVDSSIKLSAGTWKVSVSADMKTLTITGEATPPTPVTVDKLYIMGTGTPKGWVGTTELTFNETAQAFEYEATVTTEDTYLTFGDAEFTSWDDFNGKHRYAPGEGNTEAVLDAEVQLVLVNDGNVLLKTPGTYKISVTKDLKMTITTGGTGINGIYVDGEAADIFSDGKPVYNLSGQRVFKGYKGVVIKNGKKVVIK